MLTPRDYQLEAHKCIWQYFKDHSIGNPVVGLPTGTGKAFQIAYFCWDALRLYPRTKILVATHVKELVDQNYEEFLEQWPEAPAGVYSAGLNRKDTHQNVIFCGIASIVKNIEAFGRVDLMLVDECHLISLSEDSMYRKVIDLLRARNPCLRIIGFTATPWRQGQGRITEGGGIFTDMCIDLTDMHSFNRFIREGYLVPLVSKETSLLLDTSGVKLLGGEFNEKQLDLAVNKDHVTFAALQETMQYVHERRSWLIFATSLDHADKIRQMLEYLGVSCRVVHSKMKKSERDENIAAWKRLEFTAIINMGVLTTGINHPALDLIVMLRPTMSSVLWVQMLGRGTRPLFVREGYDLNTTEGRLASIATSPKQNCRILDFAGNIKRLGPINDPVLPRKKGEPTGEVPIKICECCDAYNHISARFCGGVPYKTNEGCGVEFIFRQQLKQEASTQEVIRTTDAPIIKIYPVQAMTVNEHRKGDKPPMVRVSYFNMGKKWMTFLMPEGNDFLRRKAEQWWRRRTNRAMPKTAAECINMIPEFDIPTHIRVWENAQPFPNVMDECFMGEFAANAPLRDEHPDHVPF